MLARAPKTRPADVALPAVNTLVRLTVGASPDPDDPPVASHVPSRIEDVQPASAQVKGGRTQLFVAVPHYPGDVDVPRPGTACTVTWVTRDGLYDLPAGFVERVVVGPVVWAWRLEVTGRAVRAQRRRYVRVRWASPVQVDLVLVAPAGGMPVDAEPPTAEAAATGEAVAAGPGDIAESWPDVVHGRALDLSEGGIRCTLPLPPLTLGQAVRVHLDVEDEALLLDGTVVRVKPASSRAGAAPGFEISIAFTEPDEYGDLLRRVVFSEQLRARRSGTA